MRILTYLIALVFLLVACKKEHTFYGHLYDAPAYDFELTSQDGKRVKLSDYLREKKIVLLFLAIPSVRMYALQHLPLWRK